MRRARVRDRMLKLFVVIASVLLGLTSCKKPPVAAPAAMSPATAVVPELPVSLARRVPADAEVCVCSANFQAHLEALRGTQVWRATAAYLDEKMPQTATWADMGKGWGIEDVSLAGGQGTGLALRGLVEVRNWYHEMQYRALCAAMLPGAAGAMDQRSLDALILTLERWEMPPLMLALRGPGAHAMLDGFAAWLEGFPRFAETPGSSITTTQGEQFGVTAVDGAMFWTPARRAEWLEALVARMPGATDTVRARLAHALDVVAGKTFVIALGRGTETAFIGIAAQKDQVRLASVAAESVLTRRELQFAGEHAGKRLLGLAFCQPVVRAALHEAEPTLSLRRGALAAMGAVPALQDVVRKIAPGVEAVAAAERAWTEREFHSLAAIAWWEQGLQAEVRGGVGARELEALRQPSRFLALADEPDALLAICGGGGRAGRVRAVFEAWAGLLHDAALGAAEAGLWGAKDELLWPGLLEVTLPGMLEAYDATKSIWQKGLDDDGAFILDTGGRMPLLPGLPPLGERVPLPRFASVHGVVNRSLVSASWGRAESGLTRLLQVLTPNAPTTLPPVERLREKTFTSWYYPLALSSEDLMPCATISDDVLIWGSSRAQQQEIATRIPAEKAEGGRIRIQLDRLREFLRAFAEARGAAAGNEVIRDVAAWLAPFRALDWRERAVGDESHSRLSWEIRDIPNYD